MRATEVARQEREKQLCVCLLMAFRALRRRLLALGIFRLVAIDANAGGRRRIMERSLRLSLHRSSCGGGVAILAIFMRGFRGFLRLGSMMTGFTLRARGGMSFVVKLHATHRGALQDYGTRRSFSRVSNYGYNKRKHN